MMKTKFLKYGLCILLIGYVMGCDEYEQKNIEKKIYVDRQSLSLFIGETVQLTASPTEGTDMYKWTSEDPLIATVSSNGLVEVISEGYTNIIVTNGELTSKVPLTAVVRIALEDVSISETMLEMTPGSKKTILVTFTPDNVNDIPEYRWSSENPDIATVNVAGEITAIGEGTTQIVFRIGDIEKKIEVDVAYTRPFKGPHILSAVAPYELRAANFDLGGEGYAFHDKDANNNTGNDNYRRNNGDSQSVPVEVEGNGDNIGFTNPGEWLLYTVEVVDAGDYKIDISIACPSPGSFHLEVDDVNVTGTIPTPATGGWGNFQLVTSPEDKLTLTLTEGKHKIKYYFEVAHNLKGFRFTKK